MALVHRSWIFWIFSTLFLILCVIRLDRRTNWLWYLVFIPVWVLDAITMICLLIFTIMHIKSEQNPYGDFDVSKQRKIWLLCIYLFKLAFLLTLCAKLDGKTSASYYEVFIPLWIFLILIGIDAYRASVKSAMNTAHRD